MKIWIALCVFVAAAFASDEEGNKFEGDMMLTPDQISAALEQDSKNGNKFAAMKARHWKTNGKTDTIEYFIESSLTSEDKAMKAIKDAVADYEKYTCIRFKRAYSKPAGAHISFFKDNGCYSYVGKISSTGQKISLGRGCWSKGTAMHEMGHALGFYHEQSRPDRDQFVEILTQNIRAGYENNFNKYNTDRVNSLGSRYDYRSMMHYGEAYFKKAHGLITIRTKDPQMQNVIGQRGGFSQGDIEQFNKMYCKGVTPSSGPVTQGPVVTDAPRTTSTSTPGCADLSSSCSSWRIICDTNKYVQSKCPATCNLCNGKTTVMPEICVDKAAQNNCNIYKNAGLCATNSYVHRECPKTCNRC